MDGESQPGILSWLTGKRSLDKGELGKGLDNVRKDLFDLYTKIGLVVGGAGIPVEQLPILQNLMRSLRSTLEVAPQPGLNQESLMRSEYARLSAALVKNKAQFDAIVNALEVLGVPARALLSPGRGSSDSLPQNVELPPEADFHGKGSPSPDRDSRASNGSSSPSPSTDPTKNGESFIYIPSSWGEESEGKEGSKEPSDPGSSNNGLPEPSSASTYQRSRTMIIGGSVFFSPARKVTSASPPLPPEEKLPPAAISLAKTPDGAPATVQREGGYLSLTRGENGGGGADSDSSDSEKALAVLSPTASNRSMDSSPSPLREFHSLTYSPPPPEPTAVEAFWRVFWGLDPSPPKPPPLPKKREPRVDERAISSRAVYDMFFGDACVDMTVPDRPTILPPAAAGARSAGHSGESSSMLSIHAPASPPLTARQTPPSGTPPLPPTAPLASHTSPQTTLSPGHVGPSPRRRGNGVPLPRQRGYLGGSGGSPLPLPPRSPRVGIRSPRTSPVQRPVRGQLPRSPLASVSSSSSSPVADGRRSSLDNTTAESPELSNPTSAHGEHANGVGEGADGILSQAGASIESPNSVLPGHGPGWRSPEPLPVTGSPQGPDSSSNCESPSHSRSGSSDWSDGGEEDGNAISTLDGAFGGVLEPPGYDELFSNGFSIHDRIADSYHEARGGEIIDELEKDTGKKVPSLGAPPSIKEDRISAHGSVAESDAGRQPFRVPVR